MDKILSFEDFVSFARILAEFAKQDETNKEIATRTMQRVAINSGLDPIYLW